MQYNRSIIQIVSARISYAAQWACLGVIRGYRYLISPYLPPSCRFTPTCSSYAAEAIEIHGPLKGMVMAFGRILRCQPFCRGGYDPVPPAKEKSDRKGRDEDSGCCMRPGNLSH